MFNGNYMIFGFDVPITYEPLFSDVAFYVGLTEFLVMLTMIWAIINMKVCADKATKAVMRNSLSPSQFTIEVRNMPTKNTTNYELIDSMWNRLEMNIGATIIDIQLGTSNTQL